MKMVHTLKMGGLPSQAIGFVGVGGIVLAYVVDARCFTAHDVHQSGINLST